MTCAPWPCHACAKASFQLEQGSFVHAEDQESKIVRGHPDWDPSWIKYRFTAWARCNNEDCKQRVAIAGSGSRLEITPNTWRDYFTPEFLAPAPRIILLPEKCPAEVVREMQAAFSLYWSHAASCASRLRVAIERLLDFLKIPRRRKINAKFHDLNLHARLENLKVHNLAAATQLLALKWLGNTGSHQSEVTQADLLDGFEILEHTLAELIDRRSDRVADLAKKLTKKHAGKG